MVIRITIITDGRVLFVITNDVLHAPHSGVVFQFNGERLGNNSIIDPNTIGEGEQGLFCLTNDRDCCRGTTLDARREWYSSDGNDLPNRLTVSATQREGLYSNRGQGTVRLNRIAVGSDPSTLPPGMFRCDISDENNAVQQLFIGIYPPNSGSDTYIQSTPEP